MIIYNVLFMVVFLLWHVVCVDDPPDDQLPMQLWQASSEASDKVKAIWTSMGDRTWHQEYAFPITVPPTTLDYTGVLDLAKKSYNWVATQPNAFKDKEGKDTTLLVAVFYDPVSNRAYASTVPLGPRKIVMTNQAQQAAPYNMAPVWWAQSKGLLLYGIPTFHAEDGAYFNWETSAGVATDGSLYPLGSIVAGYGKFPSESAPKERTPCYKPKSLGGSRSPTCMKVAQKLGVGYKGNLNPRRDPEPEPDELPTDEDNENDFNDMDPFTEEEWEAAEQMVAAQQATQSAAGPPALILPPTRQRRGAAIPINLERRAGTDIVNSSSFAGAIALPTTVSLVTLSNLPASDYTTPTTAVPSQTTAPSTTQPPAPSCTLQKADPDQNISPYCVCDGSVTVPVQSVSITAYAQSCSFSTLPGASNQITPTTALGPATTNSVMCQVCTPVVNNEDSCNTIPGCIVQTGAVTVIAGSSPVHLGTLTGTALYTSVSNALQTLCPSVTQTASLTVCSLGSVAIKNIDYVDGSGYLSHEGELVVTVESSGYNATSIRDAIIKTAALTVQNAAMGNNCYTAHFTEEAFKSKRDGLGFFEWLSRFQKREHPYPEHETATWCNTVGFAGVSYYGPYWHVDDVTQPTNWIWPHWDFHVAPGGDFLCDLLNDAAEALAVVQPEFAVEDIELGEAIQLLCKDSEESA